MSDSAREPNSAPSAPSENLLFQKYTVRMPRGDHPMEVAHHNELFYIRTGAGVVALSWAETDGGYSLVRIDGRPHEARIGRSADGGYQVEWRGYWGQIRVEDDLAFRARLAHAQHGGLVPLRSPMPGMVIKVLVEEGQTVSLEQPVMIIEAMKMQNELSAPLAGTITKLAVEPGQAVEADQLLLEIKP
jgi:acetyl/propionyl-CoA carboxylase alpha subunit